MEELKVLANLEYFGELCEKVVHIDLLIINEMCNFFFLPC